VGLRLKEDDVSAFQCAAKILGATNDSDVLRRSIHAVGKMDDDRKKKDAELKLANQETERMRQDRERSSRRSWISMLYKVATDREFYEATGRWPTGKFLP
jgi:hypothetical protein